MILDNLKSYKIILASNSPRRQNLIKELGVKIEIAKPIDTDETYPQNIETHKIPEYLSQKKAKAYKHLIKQNNLLITADTVVILNNKIINKPKDKNDAHNILQQISNNKHTVITGVCITTNNKQITFSEQSQVYFDKLTDTEIDYYITNYKPFDKAGAYGIQEWIGYIGIKKIEGSFYNIMGLPIQKLYKQLKNFT